MYVKRSPLGQIVALSQLPEEGFVWIDDHDQELQSFLVKLPKDQDKQAHLGRTDAELARVLEDVIDLLTQKGLIQFTELPPAAQEKLLKRKHIRQTEKLRLFDDENGGTIKL